VSIGNPILAGEAPFAYLIFISMLAEIYVPFVDVTGLFSLGENAIAKEPGSSYHKP
jgi:hypothetical protein